MNTATQQIPEKNIFKGAVAQSAILDPLDNPRSVRWGIGAGLLLMKAEPRETGMQLGIVPQGELVAFFGDTFSVDAGSLEGDRSVPYELTPLEAINKVVDDYGNIDKPKGFREIKSLAGIIDEKQIAAIEFIVNAPFETLEHTCPEGLTVCPTCRLELLKDVPARIQGLAPQFGVDADLCTKVLEDIRIANQELHTYYTNEWANIKAELENSSKGGRGIKSLTVDHLYIRACLHESAPEEKQAQIQTAYSQVLAEQMAEASKQTAQMFAEALKTSQSGSDDRMLMILEQMMKENERRDAMMQQLLAQTVTQSPNPPVVTENKGKNKE